MIPMKNIKKISIAAYLSILIFAAYGNNIRVGDNIQLLEHSVEGGHMLVSFDIQWENSWRLASGPSNWDAAWVFIKYRESEGEWQHAWIHDAGHTAPAGSVVDVGLLYPEQAYHETDNPGMGVFIYRDAEGGGDFELEDVRVRWNYALNGVADDAILDIRVFAVEMVYIPQGSYLLGSNAAFPEIYSFYQMGPTGQYSASHGTATAARSFDHNIATYWEPGNVYEPVWLQVDLGAGNEIAMEHFRWYIRSTARYAPRHFQVQASNNGSSWTTIYADEGTNAAGWYSFHFTTPQPYRYYRWYIESCWEGTLRRPWIGSLQFHVPAYEVTSEDAIEVGDQSWALNYPVHGNAGDGLGPIPDEFPKGFDAFYLMKYPVTQKQYVDFLNTVTRQQQQALFPAMVRWRYMGNHTSNIVTNRNGVRLVDLTTDPLPRIFANHLTASGDFDKDDDGQWIACNFMDYIWAAAFADWSGLRPYTELEYEKASRGPLSAVSGEYVWGNTQLERATGIVDGGTEDEIASPPGANSIYGGNIGGPMRVGNFSRESSNRIQAGNTYFGVRDMAGNLFEIIVTAGIPQGRSFTALHGDGSLSLDGYADVPDWPGYVESTGLITARAGKGLRGGAWNYAETYMRTADRQWAARQLVGNYAGFRAARTAPQQ